MAKINPNIKRTIPRQPTLDVKQLCLQIIEGDRYALSKAITLVESESEQDEKLAYEMLSILLKTPRFSQRIGISGAPGSGKSTLIDTLGMFLINSDKNPAVLAIDPSSSRTGGSILGDKTRMSRLAMEEAAFIRPSAAGKTLGGVARKTRESMILLEAAGFDPILIETVGVGQSETMVKSMTDLFILLIAPGAGDEIQGIKRGIVELADIIVINKMDGTLKPQAIQTMDQYSQAISLINRAEERPISILGVSAIESIGIDQLWQTTIDLLESKKTSGSLFDSRKKQNLKWFEDHVRDGIFERLMKSNTISTAFLKLKKQVRNGEISPFIASQRFFEILNTIDEI